MGEEEGHRGSPGSISSLLDNGGRPGILPTHMQGKIRVGIVFGGRSAEHEVSLQSAKNVLEALDRDRFEPVLIGIDREGRWRLDEQTKLLFDSARPLPNLTADSPREVALAARGEQSRLLDLSGNRELGRIDVLFPVLHGPYGEDGSVQGLAKLANLPCVGAGILGSAVGMDKDVMKRLLRDAGIPIARFLVLARGKPVPAFASISADLGSPVFVKPANLGSSVGISRAGSAEEFTRAVAAAFQYDTKLVVEESITRPGDRMLRAGKREPAGLGARGDRHRRRPRFLRLRGEVPRRARGAAAASPRSWMRMPPRGCARSPCAPTPCSAARAWRGWTCSCAAGEVLVNEINTIPGFTRISMYPKLWEASGISYGELVTRLIELAMERHAVEQGLKTTP